MGADKSAENTPNAPKLICPICLPKPKRSGFQWKKASLGVHSPWQWACDCLIWRNLSHKNKNMMAGHFSHLLLAALFHLCLQKWGNFSGYMPYSLAALDETSSLDSHNGTKTFLKLHFNWSHNIFSILSVIKKNGNWKLFCVIEAECQHLHAVTEMFWPSW